MALGLVYLGLAIRERRACWLAGGVASMLFLAVFWRAGLAMQALLQVYYIAVAVHGWHHWGRTDARDGARVHLAAPWQHALALALIVGLAAISQVARDGLGDAGGWLDSLTSWGGVVATWMVARKVLEAWLWWIVVNAATVVLYVQADLLASAGLYVLYSTIACLGFREWRKHYRQQSSQPASASA